MRFITKCCFILLPVLLILERNGRPVHATDPNTTIQIVPFTKCNAESFRGSFYDYQAMDLHELDVILLSKYRGKQEPGSNGTEIMNCVRWVRPGSDFNPGFQFFHKIQVNGAGEHPVYRFLKDACPTTRDGFKHPITDLYYTPLRISDVRWNFEKFLVDHRGKPIFRFDPTTEPADIERFVADAIGQATAEQANSIEDGYYQFGSGRSRRSH